MAMTELLLAKHPRLSTFYAVWLAASQGHKSVVDVLIQHQRRFKQPLPLRSPRALQHAIRRNQRDLASLMMSAHEDSADIYDLDLFACRNFESRSTYALFQQNNPTLPSKEELDLGMALNCAIYYNDIASAGTLIEAGVRADANIYITNLRYLATNLSLACRLGHANIVRLLLKHGANPVCDGLLSLDLLEATLESESADTLRVLFATGAALSTRQDDWSCSPFNASVQKICQKGLNDILKLLIDAGLDVNQLHVEDGTNEKTTLLHIAAMRQPTETTYETTKLLLEAGADPRVRVDFRTASDLVYLHWMGMNGRTPASAVAKRTAELLNMWERRRDVMDHQSWL
jgi:ankyrin repeat protein